MRSYFCILFLFSSLITFAHAPQWGKTGHRATAEIAVSYLTDKAKKNIEKLLDGDGLALVSTYPDDIKSDPQYDEYAIWHYINIPEGENYETVKDTVGPNIIYALDKVKNGLKDEDTPRAEKQFYLKFLIHLIGDLHQPLHIGRPDDLGGNAIITFWFGETSNLHKVWDSEMLDSYKMSYTELAANEAKLTKEELDEIKQGTPVDWMKEVHQITDEIYDSAQNGDQLSYEYMYDWMPVVREQLQKGGIRLAKELNEIFG